MLSGLISELGTLRFQVHLQQAFQTILGSQSWSNDPLVYQLDKTYFIVLAYRDITPQYRTWRLQNTGLGRIPCETTVGCRNQAIGRWETPETWMCGRGCVRPSPQIPRDPRALTEPTNSQRSESFDGKKSRVDQRSERKKLGGTLEDLHGPCFKLKDIGARNIENCSRYQMKLMNMWYLIEWILVTAAIFGSYSFCCCPRINARTWGFPFSLTQPFFLFSEVHHLRVRRVAARGAVVVPVLMVDFMPSPSWPSLDAPRKFRSRNTGVASFWTLWSPENPTKIDQKSSIKEFGASKHQPVLYRFISKNVPSDDLCWRLYHRISPQKQVFNIANQSDSSAMQGIEPHLIRYHLKLDAANPYYITLYLDGKSLQKWET